MGLFLCTFVCICFSVCICAGCESKKERRVGNPLLTLWKAIMLKKRRVITKGCAGDFNCWILCVYIFFSAWVKNWKINERESLSMTSLSSCLLFDITTLASLLQYVFYLKKYILISFAANYDAGIVKLSSFGICQYLHIFPQMLHTETGTALCLLVLMAL